MDRRSFLRFLSAAPAVAAAPALAKAAVLFPKPELIVDGSITASKLAANSICAEKIAVGTIHARRIAIGYAIGEDGFFAPSAARVVDEVLS